MQKGKNRFSYFAALACCVLGLSSFAYAESVPDVDCSSDESTQDGIKRCFDKLREAGCSEAGLRASDCRNMRQFCGCVDKPKNEKPADKDKPKNGKPANKTKPQSNSSDNG